MAQISIGETRWRMLRTALRHRKFQFKDVRLPSRNDAKNFEYLLENGLLTRLGDAPAARDGAGVAWAADGPAGYYAVTDKGKAAADLGLIEWNPSPRPAGPPQVEPPQVEPPQAVPPQVKAGRRRTAKAGA